MFVSNVVRNWFAGKIPLAILYRYNSLNTFAPLSTMQLQPALTDLLQMAYSAEKALFDTFGIAKNTTYIQPKLVCLKLSGNLSPKPNALSKEECPKSIKPVKIEYGLCEK